MNAMMAPGILSPQSYHIKHHHYISQCPSWDTIIKRLDIQILISNALTPYNSITLP